MKLTILFWNINQLNRARLINELIKEHSVDIILLAESNIEDGELLRQINDGNKRIFRSAENNENRVKLYARDPVEYMKPIADHGTTAIREVLIESSLSILIVAIHLRSKMFSSDVDQTLQSTETIGQIEIAENIVEHSRTIVIGDLNMNPFEPGLIGASAFNAVMDRRIASRRYRTVEGKKYKFFYNPMWSKFGDLNEGPPRTYYYDDSSQANYYWNIFDQILVRPELLEDYEIEDVKVIDTIFETSLVNASGKPVSTIGADHLPVIVRLSNEGGN